MLYFDANAGASLRPSVSELLQSWGSSVLCVRNASSTHTFGRAARALLSTSRKEILSSLGLSPREANLVFTSGGTEACNMMLWGFLGEGTGQKVVSSAIEHPAVLEPLRDLEKKSRIELSVVQPDATGIISAEQFASVVTSDTALITLMTANNETGALQPVAELAALLRGQGFFGVIVSDFTQGFGKSTVSVAELFQAGVDAVAVSGHKVGALAGVGALVLNNQSKKRCLLFEPLLRGGPQEGRFRAGTENLLGAVAFGKAATELSEVYERERETISSLRELFWAELKTTIPELVRITPSKESAISNTLAVRFPSVRADDLVVGFDLAGLAASTGAACSSGRVGHSPVLLAMGLSEEMAKEVVRFSLNWDATERQVMEACKIVSEVFQRMSAETNGKQLRGVSQELGSAVV